MRTWFRLGLVVLAVVLGGPRHRCLHCATAVTPEATYGDHLTGNPRECRPVDFCQGFKLEVHCVRRECRQALVARVQENALLMIVFQTEVQKHSRCDWCQALCSSQHQCSRCGTKAYCSQGCLDRDQAAGHHKLCSLNPDPRKVKAKRRE